MSFTYSRTIWTKTKSMKSQTQFCFVFIVTRSLQRLQLDFTKIILSFFLIFRKFMLKLTHGQRDIAQRICIVRIAMIYKAYNGFQVDACDWMVSRPIRERYLKTNLGFIQNIHLLICHFIIRI